MLLRVQDVSSQLDVTYDVLLCSWGEDSHQKTETEDESQKRPERGPAASWGARVDWGAWVWRRLQPRGTNVSCTQRNCT